MKYILLVLAMLFAIVGQILLKNGVNAAQLSLSPPSIIKSLFTPMIILGFLFYGISSLLWLFVLKQFPLSIAAPVLSLSYVLLFLYGVVFLKEAVNTYNYIGMIIIVLGVFLISLR